MRDVDSPSPRSRHGHRYAEPLGRNRCDRLAFGGVFGLAGTFVEAAALRQIFWAIDGVGLMVATALLTVKFARKANDCLAAGFPEFVAGESLLLSGTAAGLQASVPSYACGIALWSAALFLISAPRTFALWIRLTGSLAAVLFAVTAGKIFWGNRCCPSQCRFRPSTIRCSSLRLQGGFGRC